MGQKINIYICYNKKYLHEFIYSHKNLNKKSLQESGHAVTFLLKLEILFKITELSKTYGTIQDSTQTSISLKRF